MTFLIILLLAAVKGEFVTHRIEKPLDPSASYALSVLHCPNRFSHIDGTLWIGLKLLPHVIPVDIFPAKVKTVEQMLETINLLLRDEGSEIVGRQLMAYKRYFSRRHQERRAWNLPRFVTLEKYLRFDLNNNRQVVAIMNTSVIDRLFLSEALKEKLKMPEHFLNQSLTTGQPLLNDTRVLFAYAGDKLTAMINVKSHSDYVWYASHELFYVSNITEFGFVSNDGSKIDIPQPYTMIIDKAVYMTTPTPDSLYAAYGSS